MNTGLDELENSIESCHMIFAESFRKSNDIPKNIDFNSFENSTKSKWEERCSKLPMMDLHLKVETFALDKISAEDYLSNPPPDTEYDDVVERTGLILGVIVSIRRKIASAIYE